KSELWWRTAPSGNQGNTGTSTTRPAISSQSFNYGNLKISGKDIKDEGNRVLWRCKDNAEAQAGLNIITRYKLETEIRIGKEKQFRYFLSRGRIPAGPAFSGEDILPFNKQKVEVKKVNDRWKIT